MGEISSLVSVLSCIVNRIWNQFAMSHIIGFHFIRDNLSEY